MKCDDCRDSGRVKVGGGWRFCYCETGDALIKSVRETIANDGVRGLRKANLSPAVNHPPHYTSHPSGVECIAVVEHMGFCLGNAIKYIWRADEKGNAIQDLEKAAWYIAREIERRKKKAT